MENVETPTVELDSSQQYPIRVQHLLQQDSQSLNGNYPMESHHQDDPQRMHASQDNQQDTAHISPEFQSNQTILKQTPLPHNSNSETPQVQQAFPLNIVELPLPIYESLDSPLENDDGASKEYKKLQSTKASSGAGMK